MRFSECSFIGNKSMQERLKGQSFRYVAFLSNS